MVKIAPLKETCLKEFEELFTAYYGELECGDDAAHLVNEYVVPDMLAGLLYIDLVWENDVAAGFVIYQIDDIDNEWNFKERWGDVREIYLAPSMRGRGYGRFLLYTAELKLKDKGAVSCYCLPYEKAVDFFKACGYVDSGEYCAELDCNVFEKKDINNHCK